MLGLVLALALTVDPFDGLPNVLETIPIDGKLESMGTPVAARAYRVKMTPDETLRWVDAAFRRANLYIPKPGNRTQLAGAPQLTGYDHPSRRSYTAIFKANPDGTTTLIAGTADLSKPAWLNVASAVPTLPGATGVTEASSENGLTLTYLVKAAAAEVEAFYGDVLPKAGFVRDGDGAAWLKNGQRLEVTQAARGKEQRSVVITVRPAGEAR